jgi:glyoxylate carboligase
VVVAPYVYIYVYILQEAALRALETPSERKARLALEKVQALKVTKAQQDMVKMANTILGKTGPMIVTLASLLAKDEMPMVPVVVRMPLEASLKKFKEYEVNAKEVISTDGTISTIVEDLKDYFEMTQPKTEHRD